MLFREGEKFHQLQERLGLPISIQEENRQDGLAWYLEQELVSEWRNFVIPRKSTKVVLRVPKGGVVR